MSEKSKGGRPPFTPNPEQRKAVAVLAGSGIPQEEIALVIGCSLSSLKRKCRRELAEGNIYLKALCVSTVASNLAKGGSVGQRAAEYLLATRFGWSKYAPPPVAPKEPELGKKEQLNQAAQTGHEETSWGDVVH